MTVYHSHLSVPSTRRLEAGSSGVAQRRSSCSLTRHTQALLWWSTFILNSYLPTTAWLILGAQRTHSRSQLSVQAVCLLSSSGAITWPITRPYQEHTADNYHTPQASSDRLSTLLQHVQLVCLHLSTSVAGSSRSDLSTTLHRSGAASLGIKGKQGEPRRARTALLTGCMYFNSYQWYRHCYGEESSLSSDGRQHD